MLQDCGPQLGELKAMGKIVIQAGLSRIEDDVLLADPLVRRSIQQMNDGNVIEIVPGRSEW